MVRGTETACVPDRQRLPMLTSHSTLNLDNLTVSWG